ncbi:MAG: hypothetical protein EA398_16735, partial [Deltaproteobacteria bacterium]
METLRRPSSPVLPFLGAALALCVLVACSSADTPAGAGVGADCTRDTDCASGSCVDGACAPTAAASDDSTAPPLLGSDSDASDVPRSDVGSFTDPDDFGEACESDADCLDGPCIRTIDGRICTIFCTDDDQCERIPEMACTRLAAGDRDSVQVCFPLSTDRCRPCQTDSQCGGLNDLCIAIEDGSFCATDCATSGLCPNGFECVLVEEGIEQCLPTSRLCGECADVDFQTSVDHCGACGNACTIDNGTPQCVDGACGIFACDPGYDNCDGSDFTGCETDVATDAGNCGACGNACDILNAAAVCEDATCAVSTCDTGFGNCDLDDETGCETPLTNNPEHCGACGNTCTLANADATCDDTTCVVEACNENFGSCDGRQSTGCETDLLASNQHCGACGSACPAGATCNGGSCVCPEGLILCGNACQAPNACGGCDPLNRIPGGACGPCGLDTFECEGLNSVTCSGATAGNICGGCITLDPPPGASCGYCGTGFAQCNADNTNVTQCVGATSSSTDDNNCGSCGVRCTGGRFCDNGNCRCPDGQVFQNNICLNTADGSVTTLEADQRTPTSLRLNAQITALGTPAADDHGFCYRVRDRVFDPVDPREPTPFGSTAPPAHGDGSSTCVSLGAPPATPPGNFNRVVTGLTSNRPYDYRAWIRRGTNPYIYGTTLSTNTCSATDSPNGEDRNCDGVDGDASDAIFVRPNGGTGSTCGRTPSSPCRTITLGISRAIAEGRNNVYVAAGTYNETVTLTTGPSLYGGFNSDFSVWNPNQSISEISPSAAAAVTIQNRSTGGTFAGFRITSGAPTGSAWSSRAMIVRNVNANFVIERNDLRPAPGRAGNPGNSGQNGGIGRAGANGSNWNVNNRAGGSGGSGCASGSFCTASGGSGGQGARGTNSGARGNNGSLWSGSRGVGGNGGSSGSYCGSNGGPGGNGTTGTDGSNGSAAARPANQNRGSVLGGTDWRAGNGNTGNAGGAGGGGGGGGGGG